MRAEDDGQAYYFHPGSAGTFFCYIELRPATNEGYVLAANSGDMQLMNAFKEIIESARRDN